MTGSIVRTSIATAAVAIAFCLPLTARADDGGNAPAPVDAGPTYPAVSGELVVEIQNDRAYHSQDRDAELNDLFTTIEPAIAVTFSENLSLQSSLVVEPVEDPEPNESREFDREGLFVEELYGEFASDGWSARAGKFNPRFGKAWDLAPGLYGVDFAEDYEITERIGAGVSYDVGSETIGTHIVSLEAFFADTTHLTRSVVRGRSRVRRSDGGPSNTGRLNSYSLTVEGESIPVLQGLTYNLGFVYQSAGEDGRPERDYVAGMTYARPLTDRIGLELLAEYAVLDNADGESDRLRRYLTTSAAATVDDLIFALSYTNRSENIRDDRDNDDFLFQASAGYFREVGIGELGFELAYLLTRDQNLKTGTVGARLTYAFEF